MGIKPFDECYFENFNEYEDIKLYEIGGYQCPPRYHYGPVVRDNYVLHYIVDGEGFLRMNGRDFSVTAGQAFITPPNELIYYEADRYEPWHYIWIILNGHKVVELLRQAGITRETPIYAPSSPCPQIEQCMQTLLRHHKNEYECMGTLYHLFHFMIQNAPRQPQTGSQEEETLLCIQKVIHYISRKYAEPIQIQDLAEYCGLNRSYLTRLFKDATGYSPQEYLILCRLNKAKKLLETTELPIQHIACSVGYKDSFAFSRLFKKKSGLSPTAYRNEHLRHTL